MSGTFSIRTYSAFGFKAHSADCSSVKTLPAVGQHGCCGAAGKLAVISPSAIGHEEQQQRSRRATPPISSLVTRSRNRSSFTKSHTPVSSSVTQGPQTARKVTKTRNSVTVTKSHNSPSAPWPRRTAKRNNLCSGASPAMCNIHCGGTSAVHLAPLRVRVPRL